MLKFNYMLFKYVETIYFIQCERMDLFLKTEKYLQNITLH